MKRATVRLRLVDGQWYAFGKGPKRHRNLLLVQAINFCKRLNRKAAHGIKEKNT